MVNRVADIHMGGKPEPGPTATRIARNVLPPMAQTNRKHASPSGSIRALAGAVVEIVAGRVVMEVMEVMEVMDCSSVDVGELRFERADLRDITTHDLVVVVAEAHPAGKRADIDGLGQRIAEALGLQVRRGVE